MEKFKIEFKTLKYIIQKASRFLLVAHRNPDGDTIGSVLALKNHLFDLKKEAIVVCEDPLPQYLTFIVKDKVFLPEEIRLQDFEVIIGCDSVERGFLEIKKKLSERQISVIFDHHPDIVLKSDLVILDFKSASTCEIIFSYLKFVEAEISPKIAHYLLIGILGDTGIFQHPNTTAQSLETSSFLMQKGASISRIIKSAFSNKKMSTLKIWGRAFEKAKINLKNGMIVTAITQQDLKLCQASLEDVSQIASILNTVPGTRFALVLSEKENGLIKGSLRSEKYKDIDVSQIAHRFGGGGHCLASGFEIKGRLKENLNGWEII